MATKRILYFTAEDHYLYRSVGPALELEAKFTGDDLGITAFRDYLRGQRGALFAVLADLAGEDFHEEQLPDVRGGDGRVLLVTANRAGLRQCYVEQSKLRFARLERTIDMVPQALAMFVRSETQRLVQYLVTLRALPRDGSAVQVLVVAPPGERAAFEQALSSDARLVFRVVDYADALRAAKLRRVPEGAAAEALFVHLTAHKAPARRAPFSTSRACSSNPRNSSSTACAGRPASRARRRSSPPRRRPPRWWWWWRSRAAFRPRSATTIAGSRRRCNASRARWSARATS